MTIIFDGADAPVTDAYFGLLALIPIIWATYRKVAGLAVSYWVPGIALILGLLVSSIVVWDVMRVRAMLESGKGLHNTRGAITNSWSITSRQRDWSKDRLAYKTIIREGFDIGNDRFSWEVAGGYSAATFSNFGTPRLSFTQGMNLQVTWFEDEAENGVRRIVKLAAAKSQMRQTDPSQGLASPVSSNKVGSFENFRQQFAYAVQSGDRQTTEALTKLPFLFGGNHIGADKFEGLWSGLTTPFNGDCLATSAATIEADASRKIVCGETIFIFRRDASDKWHFVELGAND
jgi:hypothetical protein